MAPFKTAALFTAFGILLASLTGPARAAPDNTLGMALLGGWIEVDGVLSAASGITGVTHSTGTCDYVITFDRTVLGCIFATAATTGHIVGIVEIGPTTLRTLTRSATDNSAVDSGFSVIVFCPK